MTTSPTLDGVLRATPDGHVVRFERDYPTDATDLWRAVTEPDRIARWLAPISGDRREGGRVQVHFDDGASDFDVVTCRAPHELVVHWRQGEGRPTTVTARITPLDDVRARLVLEHERLSAEAAPQYAGGWHWHLDALAATLTGREPGPWQQPFETLQEGYAARVRATG
jgi:uncharacterized protein YndB with AHSA1/START domain